MPAISLTQQPAKALVPVTAGTLIAAEMQSTDSTPTLSGPL